MSVLTGHGGDPQSDSDREFYLCSLENRREQTRTDENRLSGGKRDGIYNDGDLRVIPLKLNFMAV